MTSTTEPDSEDKRGSVEISTRDVLTGGKCIIWIPGAQRCHTNTWSPA